MNISRNLGTALLLGVIGAAVGIALLVIFIFPPNSWINTSAGEQPAAGEEAARAQDEPAQDEQAQNEQAQDDQAQDDQAQDDQAQDAQDVSRERAGEIAVEHVGEGRVTWSGREDDHGALWEIEVTQPNGAESNVYVSAEGEVTHVSDDGRNNGAGGEPAGDGDQQQPAPEPAQPEPEPAPAQSGTIDAQRAGEIAASHVGGTVDEVYREDGDYGATWDVDVYTAEGDYTVYVSAGGEVVRVEGPAED